MGVTVRHVYTSPQTDVGSTQLVQPSDWNSAHALTQQNVERVGVSGGNTAGDTGLTYGSVYFQGGNNVTLSQITGAGSLGTIVVSGVNTVAQSNQSAIKALGASNTGNTAGNTGVSTGIDWVLAGSNNVTISQSTAPGGPNTLWVSGPTVGGAQTGISGVGVSNTTYTSGTVIFSNQANITLGSSVDGASQYVRLSVAAQSAETAISGIGASDTTYASGTVIFSNQANVTIGTSVNGASQYVRFSGNAAQTNQSAIKGLGVSNTGNTAGNTGLSTGIDWVIAGSNNITASQSTAPGGPNTIWISGGVGGGGNFSAGVSNLGNTAGSTGVTGTRLVMVGSGVMSLSQATDANGGTLSINAPATSSLSGVAPNISVTTNGSTISISYVPMLSYYRNMDPILGTNTQTVGLTSFVQPFIMPQPISISYIRIPISGAATSTTFATTANTAFSCSILSTINCVIYSAGIGASSRSLQSVASGSAGVSQRWSVSAAAGAGSNWTISFQVTHPREGASTDNLSTTFAKSTGSFQVSTQSLSDFTNWRFLDIPFANSLSPGNYWMILGVSSTTSTQQTAALTGARLSFSSMAVTQINNAFGLMGSATASSIQLQYGLGSFSTNPSGTTASLGFSNISSSASHMVLPFEMIRQA